MTQETLILTEKERGKRKTAFRTEVLIVALIVASLFGVPNAFELFKVAFIPLLAYAGAMRGIDAHYAPKRV